MFLAEFSFALNCNVNIRLNFHPAQQGLNVAIQNTYTGDWSAPSITNGSGSTTIRDVGQGTYIIDATNSNGDSWYSNDFFVPTTGCRNSVFDVFPDGTVTRRSGGKNSGNYVIEQGDPIRGM